MQKWFGSRMPVADHVKLQQRSTYILPTKAGVFMIGVIILMMVGATNYQNNLAFMLTFMIASVGLVSILYTFNNLQGLTFEAGNSSSVFAGDQLLIMAYASSQKKAQHMAIGAGFQKQSLVYLNVDGEKGNRFSLPITTEDRGWFKVPRIIVTSCYPFGLLKVWSWFQFASPILVYPRPIEPPIGGGFAGSETDENDSKTAGIDDLYGLKTYQAGDPIARIDWKALARERGLFTKEFVSYQNQELVFDWNDFPTSDTELRLSFLCYLVVEASAQNFEYSLNIPDVFIAKNSGETHKVQCLEALACFGLNKSK